MAAFRIAVIGGDGIGPEVIDQAIRVADSALKYDKASIEWNRLPWSGVHYLKTREMMPKPTGISTPPIRTLPGTFHSRFPGLR